MKKTHLTLLIAALLVAFGLWLARSARRSDRFGFLKTTQSTNGAVFEAQNGSPSAGTKLDSHERRLAPPDPIRRFRDFTPEQRVEFARQGHGPGG
jgi:hypothetical protein